MLPVTVAEGFRRTGQQQLPRHEEVMCDGIGGEMAEITVSDGAQAIITGFGEDLLADVPEMTVSAGGDVLLGERDIGSHRAVEKALRMSTQQLGHGGGEEMQRVEERAPEEDVRRRTERPDGPRQQQHQQQGCCYCRHALPRDRGTAHAQRKVRTAFRAALRASMMLS